MGNREEHAGRSRGCAAPLLPFLQCTDRYSEQPRKISLRQPYPSSGFGNGWKHYDTPELTPLDFTDSLKDLSANVPGALFSHFQSPDESEVLIIRQVLADKAGEEPGFNEREHWLTIRQRRSLV
jgi:hypothetical protein